MLKSSTTARTVRPVIHPGSILKEDLADANLSIQELARRLAVPANRISRIVNGERGITADTAIRLAAFWGTTAEYWMNLQSLYELDLAHRNTPRLASAVRRWREAS